MELGARIEERLGSLGITQSELARRTSLPQTTVNSLIRAGRRSTPHIVRLARALQTTPAYLLGETDDPDPGALPPRSEPTVLHVMLPVALPSENALARMFEGVLEVADLSAPPAELARELAQLLPTALSALKGPLTEIELVEPPRRAERAAALATADRGSAR